MVKDSYVWVLLFLRLGVSFLTFGGLYFLRLGFVFLRFVVKDSYVWVLVTWASQRETKLKIALRFFFFFSSFSHKSPSGP